MKPFFYLILSVFLFNSCTQPIPQYSKIDIKGEAQGTYYSISYFDKENRNLQSQIDSVLSLFDLSASNYLHESIISKVNRNERVVLDEIFKGNFRLAMQVSQQTDGDFDITVRPLVEAWGFGKRKPKDMDSASVDSIMQFIGYTKVQLVDGKVVKSNPHIQLDFDALAQGYSVDVVSNFLKQCGIKYYMVDIGGEVYASKSKPDGSPWKIGIEFPKENASYGEDLAAIIPLRALGMATSGNYRKFYIKDGVKYAHTINPHTGFPIARSLLSATVIAPTAAEADAYATSFMVMGMEKSKLFLSNNSEIQAYLIFSDSIGQYQYFATDSIKFMLDSSK